MPEVTHSAGWRWRATRRDPASLEGEARARSMNIKRASSSPANTMLLTYTVQCGDEGFTVFAFSSLPSFTEYGHGRNHVSFHIRCSTFSSLRAFAPCLSLEAMSLYSVSCEATESVEFLGRFDQSIDRSNREIREYPTLLVLSSPLVSSPAPLSEAVFPLPVLPLPSSARCTLNALLRSSPLALPLALPLIPMRPMCNVPIALKFCLSPSSSSSSSSS